MHHINDLTGRVLHASHYFKILIMNEHEDILEEDAIVVEV